MSFKTNQTQQITLPFGAERLSEKFNSTCKSKFHTED